MSWKKDHEKFRERVFKASGTKSLLGFDKKVTRTANAKGITSEEALFLLANEYSVGFTRELLKLPEEGRHRVSQIVNTSFSNTTSHMRIDKRIWQITNSPIGNLNTGDNSIVSQNNSEGILGEELVALVESIKNSKEITSPDKEDLESDIQTIAAQVSKNKKDKGIIRAAWTNLSRLADIEGCAQVIARITPLIQNFLG